MCGGAGTILSDDINKYFYLFVWFFMASVQELNYQTVYVYCQCKDVSLFYDAAKGK
jgi:hypothetical protein